MGDVVVCMSYVNFNTGRFFVFAFFPEQSRCFGERINVVIFRVSFILCGNIIRS